jgi:D-aspartate ligase
VSSESQGIQRPYAIVIGLDGMNGIQTARLLARHDIPVIAIAKDPDHYCCRTRVCERILFADTAGEELITTLEALGPTLDQKAVLFPCMDMNVLLVSRYRQRLEPWYHVILPAPEVVEMMMDKVRFYTYAQENGFRVPRTFYLRNRADAEEAAESLAFPCILSHP